MVGGVPITKAFAEEMGANGYAADASSAARVVREVSAA
jgi:methanogenic corrinoid protein MtbC1